MRKFILSLMLLTLLLVTNCGEDKKANTTEIKETISSETLDKFETKAFIDKYNVYIDFGNNFDDSAAKSYDHYFNWVDREKGPSSDVKNVRGVRKLNDYQLKNLEKAIASEPEIEEVDELMLVVLEKAKTLYAVLDDANSYYDRQDYKDDNFTRGQTLHNSLVDAYDQYFDSYFLMNKNFKIVQNNLGEFEANKYKEEGQLIRYALLIQL